MQMRFNHANNSPKILAGNYNAHNLLWTSHKFYSNGRQLQNILATMDLVFLYPHDKNHYNFTHQVGPILDLVLVTSSLLADLHIYEHPDLTGNDHRPIIVHTPLANSALPSLTRPFSYKKK